MPVQDDHRGDVQRDRRDEERDIREPNERVVHDDDIVADDNRIHERLAPVMDRQILIREYRAEQHNPRNADLEQRQSFVRGYLLHKIVSPVERPVFSAREVELVSVGQARPESNEALDDARRVPEDLVRGDSLRRVQALDDIRLDRSDGRAVEEVLAEIAAAVLVVERDVGLRCGGVARRNGERAT